MGLGAPAWVLLPPVALEEPSPKAILEPSGDKSGTRWLKAGALQWPLHGERDLCGAIAAAQAQGGGGELISFFKYGKNYCNKESNKFSPMFKCEGFAL